MLSPGIMESPEDTISFMDDIRGYSDGKLFPVAGYDILSHFNICNKQLVLANKNSSIP